MRMHLFTFSRFVVPALAGILGAMAADFVFAPLIRANVPGWGGFTFGFWGQLPFAIAFGFAAGRMRRRGDLWNVRFPHKGPKLREWAAIAGIFLVTAAILYPAFERERYKSRFVSCLSNMKRLGMATLMYAQDNDDRLFPASYPHGGKTVYWFGTSSLEEEYIYRYGNGVVSPYLQNDPVFDCPEAAHRNLVTLTPTGDMVAAGQIPAFGINSALLFQSPTDNAPLATPPLLHDFDNAAETLLFADAAQPTGRRASGVARSALVLPPSSGATTIHARHANRANVVWADGHVKAMPVAYNNRVEEGRKLGVLLPAARTDIPEIDDYYFHLHKKITR